MTIEEQIAQQIADKCAEEFGTDPVPAHKFHEIVEKEISAVRTKVIPLVLKINRQKRIAS